MKHILFSLSQNTQFPYCAWHTNQFRISPHFSARHSHRFVLHDSAPVNSMARLGSEREEDAGSIPSLPQDPRGRACSHVSARQRGNLFCHCPIQSL